MAYGLLGMWGHFALTQGHIRLVCVLWALLAPGYAGAEREQFVGVPSVIDGDTLELHGARLRIEGIDAPESDQFCIGEKGAWPCGRRAAAALDDFISRRTVSCTVAGRDRYRRFLVDCDVGGRSLADWMVREGWAVAYRKYSMRYVEAEEEAHMSKRNIWGGQFEAPWDYRRRKRGG